MPIVQLLIALAAAAPSLVPDIRRIFDSLHKTGELTDAEWTAHVADLGEIMAQPHWQPELPPTAKPGT